MQSLLATNMTWSQDESRKASALMINKQENLQSVFIFYHQYEDFFTKITSKITVIYIKPQ